MFFSIIFLLLMIAAATGLILYPKSKKRLNGAETLIFVPLALSGYLVLSCRLSLAIWKKISIPIVMLPLFALALALWLVIIRRQKRQGYFWRRFDAAGLILTVAFVLFIALHIYGSSLSVRYSSPVGTSQFLDAMSLLNEDTMTKDISFSSYIGALFIAVMKPFTGSVFCYKSFMIAEIFLRLLEAGAMYGIVHTISDRKIVRYAAPAISVCYFFGYPALSLFWANYDYWNVGALMILWIVYALLVIERKPKLRLYAGIFLAEALLVELVSGQYYAALHMMGVAVVLLALWMRERKRIERFRIKYGSLAEIIGFALVAVGLFCSEFFVKLRGAAPGALQASGMYRSMYGDLLFFLPALFFLAAYVWWKKKRFQSVAGIAAAFLAATMILYALWYEGKLDTYYYFLNYYNLWVIGWILVAASLEVMAETKQLPIFFSYAGMVAALAVLTLTNYDYHMWHHNVSYNGSYVTKNFFPLYRQNMDSLLTDYGDYEVTGSDVVEAYQFLEKNGQEETVASVTENGTAQYLFDALWAAQSSGYRVDEREFPMIVQQLETNRVNAIMVLKDEEQYQIYRHYYEACDILFENDGVLICAAKDGDWMGVRDTSDHYMQQKAELFSQTLTDAEDIVPLMASETSYMDFILYEDVTGKSMEEFYTWKYGPVDNLHNLNGHGVKRIVVLKDDEYYQTTKDYFKRHKIVYENEAGYILECEGTEWSTTY